MNTSETTNDATRRRRPEIEDLCETVLEAPVYDREDPPSHASLVAAYVALTELAQDLAARVKGCGDARDAMEALAERDGEVAPQRLEGRGDGEEKSPKGGRP